jgi:hypothetical protein
MIRRHDVQVLAEGTFRVVLTEQGRVAAAIEVEESALGPLHLLFEVSLPSHPAIRTGSIFDDIGRAVQHVTHDVSHAASDVGRIAGAAAEHVFDAASKVATTVARPAFNVARDAAASGAHILATAPFMPEAERKRIEAASRVIMRARLGDVNAKQFIRDVVKAANAGVAGARHVGDALLKGTSVVAHVLDAPLALAEHVPLIGGTLHALSPFQKLEKIATAIRHGDFDAVKRIVSDDARLAEGVVSLVPGIGSGVGAAISTGLAVLDGGAPLDIALHAAYGAIPIPPGIRNVTDAVLESVLRLAHHGQVTDAAIAAARNAVPAGLPRDVFDTLAQLVVKRVPVQRAAEALVSHYVQRYAPSIPIPDLAKGIGDSVHHLAEGSLGDLGKLGALAKHLGVPADALSAAARHLGVPASTLSAATSHLLQPHAPAPQLGPLHDAIASVIHAVPRLAAPQPGGH